MGLIVKNLTFSFGEKQILDDVSFHIKPGEIVLLAGASGSGKSSLASLLTGYYPYNGGTLSSGTVHFDTLNIQEMDNKEILPYLSASFQNARLSFTSETLREEFIFILENLEVDPSVMDAILEKHAKETQVTHLLSKRFDVLSGGELQRASFSCLQLINPKLYIMDEPFSNLDDEAIVELQQTIKDLKKQGHAVLIIDHRLDRWDFVDRLMLLNQKGDLVKDHISLKEITAEDQALLEKEGLMRAFSKLSSKSTVASDPLFQMKNINLNLGYYKRKLFSKKWIDTENILENSNLQLFPGELVALQGKSGSGKSTLFKAILGEWPIEGEMQLDGLVFSDKQKEWLHNIGIVFQDPSTQFLATSCYGEVRISLEAAHLEASEDFIEREIELLLERHGLLEQKNQSPWLLSQGQQRRLAVLCMLVGDQKLLLVDEPTYGQDKKHAIEIMDNLDDLRKTGTTILFTSHDQELVQAYADRSYVLNHNKLEEIDYD